MAQLKDTAINNQPIADFVIETGASGNWTYRKWSSGIAEQWYIGNRIETTLGALNIEDYTYQHSSGIVLIGTNTMLYPISFISSPYVNVSVSYNNIFGWVKQTGATEDILKKAVPGTTVNMTTEMRNTVNNNTQFWYQITIYAKGRWK